MPKIAYVYSEPKESKKISKSSRFMPYINAVTTAPKDQLVLVPERIVPKEDEPLFRALVHKNGLSAIKGSYRTSEASKREVRGFALSIKTPKKTRRTIEPINEQETVGEIA